MRLIPYYIIILFVTSSCISNTQNTPPLVNSWEEIETNAFNVKIQKSYEAGLEWVRKPELYILNLFDLSNLKKISYEYKADNIENPKNIEITLIRDGFLDDSVRGDIQRISLTKDKEGVWVVKTIKKSMSCWRTNKTTYSVNQCP